MIRKVGCNGVNHPIQYTCKTIQMIMINPRTIVAPPDSKCCLKVKKETNKLVKPMIVNKTIPGIRKFLKGEFIKRSTDTPKLSPLGSNMTPKSTCYSTNSDK